MALLFCLLTTTVFAANVVRYVNTASSGGNGTTNETSGANAAYATLAACEDAEDGVAYSAGETCTINCSGATADTTPVNFSGWDADVSIIVNGDNTTGKWNTGAYRIEITQNNDFPCITNTINNIQFVNLQCKMIASGNYGNMYLVSNTPAGAHTVLFSKCIFWANDSSTWTNSQGITLNWAGGTGTVTIKDCEIYRTGGAAAGSAIYINQYGTANIYNCTITGNWNYGINRADGTVVAKNCYSATTSGSSYNGTITQTTCASSDTTASGTALDSIAYSTDNFTNVTAGSEDLHLTAASALKDVGTDLGTDTDIDGQDRDTNTPWDIGADEYVATGSSTPATRRNSILFIGSQ